MRYCTVLVVEFYSQYVIPRFWFSHPTASVLFHMSRWQILQDVLFRSCVFLNPAASVSFHNSGCQIRQPVCHSGTLAVESKVFSFLITCLPMSERLSGASLVV